MCLAYAAQKGYTIYQYDIEQAFITDEADFESFVSPIWGCKTELDATGQPIKPLLLDEPQIGANGKPMIWRVLKNWYGNRQGPRVFASKFKEHICSKKGGGWKQSQTAPCLYIWRGRRGDFVRPDGSKLSKWPSAGYSAGSSTSHDEPHCGSAPASQFPRSHLGMDSLWFSRVDNAMDPSTLSPPHG